MNLLLIQVIAVNLPSAYDCHLKLFIIEISLLHHSIVIIVTITYCFTYFHLSSYQENGLSISIKIN